MNYLLETILMALALGILYFVAINHEKRIRVVEKEDKGVKHSYYLTGCTFEELSKPIDEILKKYIKEPDEVEL
jgi:hypothetical protein